MGEFVADYDMSAVQPAAYNPRIIKPEMFARLRQSVTECGIVKAIIVEKKGTIIAGHQRTKAMMAEGITTSPAYVLEDCNVADEIRFNQLHNASDEDYGSSGIRVDLTGRGVGWHVIPVDDIEVLGRPRAAGKVKEICGLLTVHGEWGNAVVTESGRIVGGQLYAYAQSLMGWPLRVCVVEDERGALIEQYLAGNYGEFSYAHLPKTTWVQSLKQPHRLRSKDDVGHGDGSKLWNMLVLPRVSKKTRILDFGAGQMDYVKLLKSENYDIRGVEFFFRTKGKLAIDMRAVHRHIDAVCEELERNGLFDCVTCDSVLNSVDSPQAEADVMTCTAALTRPGGITCLTGHSREEHDYREHNLRTTTQKNRLVNYYDADGFTGMFDRGVWSYQLYHTKERAEEIGRQYVTPDIEYARVGGWCGIIGRRSVELPQAFVEGALAREFDLPWPGGQSVNRSKEIIDAYRKAVAISGRGSVRGAAVELRNLDMVQDARTEQEKLILAGVVQR